jgi:hypothetical protein
MPKIGASRGRHDRAKPACGLRRYPAATEEVAPYQIERSPIMKRVLLIVAATLGLTLGGLLPMNSADAQIGIRGGVGRGGVSVNVGRGYRYGRNYGGYRYGYRPYYRSYYRPYARYSYGYPRYYSRYYYGYPRYSSGYYYYGPRAGVYVR